MEYDVGNSILSMAWYLVKVFLCNVFIRIDIVKKLIVVIFLFHV